MIVRDAGEHAVLIEYGDLRETMAFFRSLHATAPADVEDLVPAARTVLVRFRGERERIVTWIRSAEPVPEDSEAKADAMTIAVRYDGPDLDDVARHTGLSTPEVVAAHTGRIWTVAFAGFAPGFGYLVSPDDRLHVPRRSEPRTSVPAGSVGLAGEFSGIYPRSSPGGWQLIGTTDAVLWDEGGSPPARLQPGTKVRFRQS
ncbi:allophanate hydrolase [Rhodococcus sp. 1163]|uniref:5-oxoprolinase subunit B family protein n=1 Tax=unclassified Rhodococcus (in: high G+C Gram-positive bacteria) TaxID=192944 RepID=UPI000A03B35F|nr:allophanate hydrolase subunit 1 [Rhodococcus sp. 1163]ORI18727.1 allophanate hydrolase [Rhodococcus sp. 1163]